MLKIYSEKNKYMYWYFLEKVHLHELLFLKQPLMDIIKHFFFKIWVSQIKWKRSIRKFYLITLLNCFQHQITFTLCNLYLSLMSWENPSTVSLFFSLFLCPHLLVVSLDAHFLIFFHFFSTAFFVMHKKCVII